LADTKTCRPFERRRAPVLAPCQIDGSVEAGTLHNFFGKRDVRHRCRAARGKLPTDVWWHTIVSPTGREKTGYPTQKPLGVLRRIVQASSREGDWCLDFFAGSGTLGAVAAQLGRRYVLIDSNPQAVEIMRARLPPADGVSARASGAPRSASGG